MSGTRAPPVEAFRFAVDGVELEAACWAGDRSRAALLLLHEGLGSVSLWGRFPARLAAASGRTVIAWSRQGYGRSAAANVPRPVDYLHREAFTVLPGVLAALQARGCFGSARPFLVGHSDGGTIALLAAAAHGEQLAGVVVMAPHLWVEAEALAGIRLAGERWRNSDLPVRLGRHHDRVERVFADWHDTWLSSDFAGWNIEAEVAKIDRPVLAIQGEQDEYATMAQIDRIAALAIAPVQLLKIADSGHAPHADQPAAVIKAIIAFAGAL